MPTREGVRDVSAQPEPTELPEPPQRPGAASPPRGDTAELVPESVPRRPPAPQVAVGEVGVGDELLHSLQGRPPVLDCGHGGGTAPALPHAAQARPSPFGTRSEHVRDPFGTRSESIRSSLESRSEPFGSRSEEPARPSAIRAAPGIAHLSSGSPASRARGAGQQFGPTRVGEAFGPT